MIKYIDSNIEMDDGRMVFCFRQEPDVDKKYTHCLIHVCENIHEEPYVGPEASIYLDPPRVEEVIKILQNYVDIMKERKENLLIERKKEKHKK